MAKANGKSTGGARATARTESAVDVYRTTDAHQPLSSGVNESHLANHAAIPIPLDGSRFVQWTERLNSLADWFDRNEGTT